MIGIFAYHQEDEFYLKSGPDKVVNNLIMGLKELKIKYHYNQNGDYNICLNPPKNISLQSMPINTFYGPNIWNEHGKDNEEFNNFIVASNWMKKMWTNVNIWSVGIDTVKYNVVKKIKYDCFIYLKNRQDNYLNVMIILLKKLKLTYKIIQYGSYEPEELLQINSEVKFCILLDNTETQGIANMEIMSCNTPIFCLDWENWENKFFEATSLPYFDETCGVKLKQNEYLKLEKEFSDFLNHLNEYQPREYILKDHTLKKSAQKLINIIT